MKKTIIKNIVLGLTALVLIPGCEDFLEQEVPGAITSDVFYQNDEEALQAANSIYDVMSAHYSTAWSSMYMVKTMPSDESNAGGANSGDQPGYQSLDDFNLDAENDKVMWAWRLSYYAIFRANLVINNVKHDSPIAQRAIAEAKALRAYSYLDLVSLWGDVPLVTTELAPSQWSSTGRAPKADVYALIEQDLKEAIEVLPLKSQYSMADRFRVSKGTAQALLGKAYLYQEKWSDAVTQLDNVIGSGQYSLESSVGVVFSEAGEFGRESLFETSFNKNESYDWGNFPWDWRPESNIHIQIMGPRADFYTKAPADSLIAGWGMNLPTDKLYRAFEAAGQLDNERRWATLFSEVELKAMGGNWTGQGSHDYEGYFQRKYGSYASQAGGPVAELNYGNNWRLIRYADVLLMAAEANFRAGNTGKAHEYLNMVRNRSELESIFPTGDALFQAIVTERQLELALEGFRYIDLVRWGLADDELAPLGFQAGKHEVLPVPAEDIRTAGLEQNNSY